MGRILFVAGGRRVLLAKRFVERGYNIYAYELTNKVPIANIGTVIQGLPWENESAFEHLESIIDLYQIDLVIPLMDAAVKVCSRLPKDKTVCSSFDTANMCLDKLLLMQFILANFPDVYPLAGSEYPVIVKPRYGFGSKNIMELKSEKEFGEFIEENNITKFVIQKKIVGKEYSVDSYFDRNSNWVDSVPRERIRVGSGEVITSKTLKDKGLITWTKIIGEQLRIIGPSNTQFIIEDATDKIYFIEVNARFGGGFTLSMKAGLDAISLIERDYFGKEFDYKAGTWEENLLMERSYEDHYFSS